jgi:hypothetical protein
MAKVDTQTVTMNVEVKYKISFWDALKLRIAGKNYQTVAKEIIKTLKKGKTK